MGSSFHREGAAYLKERFVIFKEEWVGGRARVTIDEERLKVDNNDDGDKDDDDDNNNTNNS